MRLINGDALIEKFNEKADMAECLVDARTAERFATFCALADAVEEMPTVDAVSVTRCKNCRSYNKPKTGWCEVHLDREHPDDFCSYGERKNVK